MLRQFCVTLLLWLHHVWIRLLSDKLMAVMSVLGLCCYKKMMLGLRDQFVSFPESLANIN